MAESRLHVMQSFKAPRPTTNPYIVMLDRALRAEPTVEHTTFSWRGALLGRVDVLHLHWPEVMLEGDKPWKRFVKRMLFRLLLLKLRLTNAAIVRTVHNVELPQDVDAATRRLLETVDRRTDFRIVLNDSTPVDDPARAATIAHGHYRDWFETYPRAAATPRRLGYFGLIRRYKGVETLLATYETAFGSDDSLSLRMGGKPSSVELEAIVAGAAQRTPGITATLRFLDDGELVEIATSSQLIVLPYRFMHNSGGVLASLSLDRPVLVPRTEVNEALAREVGEQWVHFYDGELTAERLLEALDATTDLSGRPDLSAREWADTGRRHAEVYRTARRR